jgi:hypothetical protein
LKHALVVLGRADVLLEARHALGDVMRRQTASLNVVVVNVAHAELGLQLHGTREKLNQLRQDVFVIRLCGIINEHDSIGVFLNSRPALFVGEVSRNVPKLKINLAKRRH